MNLAKKDMNEIIYQTLMCFYNAGIISNEQFIKVRQAMDETPNIDVNDPGEPATLEEALGNFKAHNLDDLLAETDETGGEETEHDSGPDVVEEIEDFTAYYNESKQEDTLIDDLITEDLDTGKRYILLDLDKIIEVINTNENYEVIRKGRNHAE
jgi:hypothetical protein